MIAGAQAGASRLLTSAPAEQRNARHQLFRLRNIFSPSPGYRYDLVV